jgi:acyl-coenzyme A synthetase/AMP-(fatty) acid ligase
VCTKDPCWSVGTIYDPRELPGVSRQTRDWTRCYKWYQRQPSRFHGRVWVRGTGIWRMADVGPEWSHGMPYDDTRHTDVAKRGGSWIGVDQQGR